MDWDGIIAGLVSSPLLVLVAGVVTKVWPDTLATFSSWLYAHVDPDKLPFGSEINKHWAQAHDMAEWKKDVEQRFTHIDDQLTEVQKDGIKNVLMFPISDKTRDNSEHVAYELAKLEALHADCWIVDAARKYLTDHANKEQA